MSFKMKLKKKKSTWNFKVHELELKEVRGGGGGGGGDDVSKLWTII